MLRVVATVGLLASLAVGLYFAVAGMKPKEDRPRPIALGFGPAMGNTVPMQIAITDLMVNADPPRPGLKMDPIEWTRAHIEVRDASDKTLNWQRLGNTQLITGHEAGISDSFIEFKLTPGATYKVIYTPVVKTGLKYSAMVTAPTATLKSQQRLSLNRE